MSVNNETYPATCKKILGDHGFESFENSDRSTSFYLPYYNAKLDLVHEELITVRTKKETRIALGY